MEGVEQMAEQTDDTIKRHIFLCATPTKAKCHTDGSGVEVWNHLKKRLRELGHGDPRTGIHRTKADCLRVCERGPTALVYPDQTWYHELTVKKMERIITEHLVGGKVVTEYVNTQPFLQIEQEG